MVPEKKPSWRGRSYATAKLQVSSGEYDVRMEQEHCFHAAKIPQLQSTATVCDTADAKSNTSEGKRGEILFG